MGFIATAARIWLTRSTKPFIFTNAYDKTLPYQQEKTLGLYVHIPFCRTICNFCPYCKVQYEHTKMERYIESLLAEIELVCNGHEKKTVTSLYFGGGSPALAAEYLDRIITTLKKYFIITEGIGIELHPSDVTVPVLTKLKAAGVDRISIGIQSFNEKFAQTLGRPAPSKKELAAALSQVQFNTVSMDLIFALPGQTPEIIKKDIDDALEAGGNHIAIYPFIDFSFTGSTVKKANNRTKRHLLNAITEYFKQIGFTRDSIWTFAKHTSQKYSSMTRDTFLGFGCSATTLLHDQFKINTFSVDEYSKRIQKNSLPTALTITFSIRQRMIYYLFWTLYTTSLNATAFEQFFHVSLQKKYGMELQFAVIMGWLKKSRGNYTLTDSGAYYFHYFENFYTLSYIDKMWGLMRTTPFPKKMEL